MVLQWFFSGSLGWLRCYIAPLCTKNLLSSCMVLQWFFSGSLGWLRCYIAPLCTKNLLSSCMVLQWFFGVIKVLYSTTVYKEPVKLLYGSSVVLQWFFSGSLGWLRCYIAPLPYKEPASPFKGSLWAKEPLLVLFSTIFVEEIQCNMAPLMVLHSSIWHRYCIASLKIWYYIAPKVVPLWLRAKNHF